MGGDLGLQQEQKCYEAIFLLQSRNWSFNGFSIFKFTRTYGHHNPKIRKLDGRKFDLVILFRHRNIEKSLVFVLQVKSTRKSYDRFKRSPTKRNIKCIWIRPSEPLKYVMADLDMLFKEVLAVDHRKNKFLRPKLLHLFDNLKTP